MNKDKSEIPEVTMSSPAATLALKSLVIGLGVLIVLGLLLVGYGFYRKSSDPDWKLIAPSTQAPATVQTLTNTDFGELLIDEPDGCEIHSVTPDNGRLYVTTCNRVYVIDAINWKILGTIRARQKP